MDYKDNKIEELEHALTDIRSRYRNLKSYRKSEYDNQLKNRLLKKTKALEEAEAKINNMVTINRDVCKLLLESYSEANGSEDEYNIGYINGIQNALMIIGIFDIADLNK